MRFKLLITLLCVLSAPTYAAELKPIQVDSLSWISPPNIPGLKATWVLGGEDKPGVYLLRVKLEKAAKILPHTHPDERITTVLSGTIWVGLGAEFNETQLVAVSAGNVYVIPAGVPHFIWAKEGEVVYQESGQGPTATAPSPK